MPGVVSDVWEFFFRARRYPSGEKESRRVYRRACLRVFLRFDVGDRDNRESVFQRKSRDVYRESFRCSRHLLPSRLFIRAITGFIESTGILAINFNFHEKSPDLIRLHYPRPDNSSTFQPASSVSLVSRYKCYDTSHCHVIYILLHDSPCLLRRPGNDSCAIWSSSLSHYREYDSSTNSSSSQ